MLVSGIEKRHDPVLCPGRGGHAGTIIDQAEQLGAVSIAMGSAPIMVRIESYGGRAPVVCLIAVLRAGERAVGRNAEPFHHGLHLHAVLADDAEIDVVE